MINDIAHPLKGFSGISVIDITSSFSIHSQVIPAHSNKYSRCIIASTNLTVQSLWHVDLPFQFCYFVTQFPISLTTVTFPYTIPVISMITCAGFLSLSTCLLTGIENWFIPSRFSIRSIRPLILPSVSMFPLRTANRSH